MSPSQAAPKILMLAQYFAYLGTGVTITAIPLFVLQTTGSAANAGIAGFAGSLPLIIVGIVGGTLVDRFGAKRVSVLQDILAAVTVCLVPFLQSFHALPLSVLFVLIALRSCFDSPGETARMVLLGNIASSDGETVSARYNSLFFAAPRLGLLAGPAITGVIALIFSPAAALYFDGLSFALSAILISLLRVSATRTPKSAGIRETVQSALGGLSVIRSSAVIFAIASIVVATNFLDEPLSSVLLPVYANQVLGDTTLAAVLLACFGGGALAGTFIYAPLTRLRRVTNYRIFALAFGAIALLRAALAFGPNFFWCAVIVTGIGLASGPLNPIIAVTVQRFIPSQQQGRVWGAFGSFAFAAAPLGQLVAGASAQSAGILTTLAWQAAIYVVINILILRSKSLRLVT